MEYMTSIEIAEKWNISSRRVTTLCKEGRVKGALFIGNTWLIPDNAIQPDKQKRGRKPQ